MTQSLIVQGSQGIAVRLTSDPDVQNELSQEPFVHFVRVQTAPPERTLAPCFQSCETHAQDCLQHGRSNDSLNNVRDGLPDPQFLSAINDHPVDDPHPAFPLVDAIELDGELITNDILAVLLPLLSGMQQLVLLFLMNGSGVREAGRQLGITHPAVIKHRRKIARIAHELLQESEGVGVATAIHNSTEENGNGSANGNREAHTG